MPISEDRADKMEQKIDTLIVAVNRLAIIDERQIESGRRVGLIEDRLAKLEAKQDAAEKKLDRWINMGVGIWGFVGFGIILYQTFRPLLGN